MPSRISIHTSDALLWTQLLTAALVAGCGRSAPPPQPAKPQVESVDKSLSQPLPQIVVPQLFQAKELAAFSCRPPIPSQPDQTLQLEFETVAELPTGASLNPQTGELKWIPTEAQGPGHYPVTIRYWDKNDPTKTLQFTYKVVVAERNAAPTIQLPETVNVDAGKTLEIPIRVIDNDFPSNQVEIELNDGRRPGMDFDAISGKLRWDVPTGWKLPQFVLTVTARDDGNPPLRSRGEINIQVRQSTVVAEEPGRKDETYRSPHAYIQLPDLPRPGEESMPVEIPIPQFKPNENANAESLRLSLLIPDESRERFTIKYSQDDFSHFTIATTEPFEAESQDPGLPDQTIAECELNGTNLKWNWVLTKNIRVRGLQNNLRECVVSIEDQRGEAQHLVALQSVQDIPGVSILSLLADDELKQRLFRKDRTTVVSPLVAKQLKLVSHAAPSISGTSELQENWLVCSFADSSLVPGVNRFNFRFFSYRDEIAVSFDSDPSIDRAKEVAASAKGLLIASQADAKRWQRKLLNARRKYAKAQSIRIRTPADKTLKAQELNKAQQDISKATFKLSQLATEISRNQAFVQTTAADLQKVLDSLSPLKTHVLCGELCRIVSDVRIVVARLSIPRPAQ